MLIICKDKLYYERFVKGFVERTGVKNCNVAFLNVFNFIYPNKKNFKGNKKCIVYNLESIFLFALNLFSHFERVVFVISGLGKAEKIRWLRWCMMVAIRITILRNSNKTQFSIIVQNQRDYRYFSRILSDLVSNGCDVHVRQVLGSGARDEFKYDFFRKRSVDWYDVPSVGFLGRLLVDKGVKSVICLSELGVVKVNVAGDLIDNKRYVSLSSLYSSRSIRYYGTLIHPEKFLEQTDIFVYLSEYGEGFPRVVLEACASGCILILPRAQLYARVFSRCSFAYFVPLSAMRSHNDKDRYVRSIIKLLVDLYRNDRVKFFELRKEAAVYAQQYFSVTNVDTVVYNEIIDS